MTEDSHFTPEQREEIDRIAVRRDMNKPRESSFSIGEEGEMQKTADRLREETAKTAENLGFNANQRKELSHLFRRRLLPLVAYLILVVGIIYSFQQERNHSNANRAAVASATAHVLRDNCEKGNAIRLVIRNILASEFPQIHHAVKIGQLSPEEGTAAIKRVHAQIATVTLSNCKAIASQVG